jgi:hydroxyethylthiazole kinase-like sugar kinase family protein
VLLILGCRVLVITVAGELAVERGVGGSGTFLPALIDAIHLVNGDDIQRLAKVDVWYGD